MVHFCHGSPGFVSLLCEAGYYLQDEAFFQAAMKAGECIWKRGILTKGNGVCHGITGNAYCLFSISRICKEDSDARDKWRYRGMLFTQLTYDKSTQEQLSTIRSPGRKVEGMADSPLSLMEGKG